jgi:hypothetical protein
MEVSVTYNGRTATFTVTLRLKIGSTTSTGRATSPERVVAIEEAVRDALSGTKFVRSMRCNGALQREMMGLDDLKALELVLVHYRE